MSSYGLSNSRQAAQRSMEASFAVDLFAALLIIVATVTWGVVLPVQIASHLS